MVLPFIDLSYVVRYSTYITLVKGAIKVPKVEESLAQRRRLRRVSLFLFYLMIEDLNPPKADHFRSLVTLVHFIA